MIGDTMKLGFIGLGRMGMNMVMNLIDHKHTVVAYNRSPEKVVEAAKYGAIKADSMVDLVKKLPEPKIVWLMINAGPPVDEHIEKLIPLLKKGDILIDGGNSYYKDSQRRYALLKKKGINYLDCGTSGGIDGARHGACMMIGGDKEIFKKVEPLFKDMTVKDGYGYMGNSGAGHFVKGVHNAIEYGMMGAIAEGMNAINQKSKDLKTDMKTVARVYAHGSIVESRLVSWLDQGMNRPYFEDIAGTVPKGETEEEMEKLESEATMKILKEARLMRINTRKNPNYMGKLLAVIRNEFGGHKFEKK